MAKKFNKKRKSEIEAKQALNRDTQRGMAKRAKAAEAVMAWVNANSPIKYGTKKPGTPVAKPAALKASGFLPPSAATNPKRLLDKKEWKKAAEYALEGNLGISSKNSAGTNAGLLAMAALPIPAPLKGVAGKGARAVAANAAKSAARRTASESATIRKGTQAGRTAEKAVELEKAAAKESSSKSVNTARQSTVELRTPTSRKKMSKKELQERLDIGARMRAEGRRPGYDIPNRDGSVNVGTSASKTPKAKDPAKPTPREKNVAEFTAGLTKPTKPTNPGKAKLDRSPGAKKTYEEKLAKYEKDLAAYEKRMAQMKRRTKLTDEGYLKADGGAPKGAVAKSVARNQRAQAKKAGAEGPKPSTKPAVKKPSVKAQGAEGPKGELVRVPTTRGRKVGGSSSKGSKPIAMGDKPFSRSREVALRETIPGQVVRRSETPKGPYSVPLTARNLTKTNKATKVAVGLAAAGAAGAALNDRYNPRNVANRKAGKGVEGPGAKRIAEAKATAKPTESAKAAAERRTKEGLLDRFGRKISREEFNKREAYRERIKNLTGAELAAAKKKEMARREKYRKTEGKARFGSQATKKTRRIGAESKTLDLRARRSLR